MDLQTRVTNILLQPAQEWQTIATEQSDVTSLIRDYAAPLAAIPAVCGWIGGSLLGLATFHPAPVQGFSNAVVSWLSSLIGCWIAAIIIEKLAPSFGSRGTTAQALKMVVYASTALWIAGVLYIFPPLAVFTIIAAVYALYLFYVGLPHVMQTPRDRVVPYMVVSAMVMIAIAVAFGILTAIVTGVSSLLGLRA